MGSAKRDIKLQGVQLERTSFLISVRQHFSSPQRGFGEALSPCFSIPTTFRVGKSQPETCLGDNEMGEHEGHFEALPHVHGILLSNPKPEAKASQ